jgi:quercetin dioxygenase-like cupin family protein
MTKAGDVFENPVTGERAIVVEGCDDNAGRRIVSEVYVRPGGAVVGEHLHPVIEETFEVLSGTMAFSVDGKESKEGPGTRVTVPPGTWHDWWNGGADDAVFRVDISPGRRFEQMIGTLFGLAIDGKTNAKGMPGLLQLSVIGQDFDDVVVFRRPPPAIQRLLFGILAPIARLRGYRSIYPRYLDAPMEGTAEDAREGRPLTPRFSDGPGPPR